jgi:hypothetical protein
MVRSRVAAKVLPVVHVPVKTMTVPSEIVINPVNPPPAPGMDAPAGSLYIDEAISSKVNEISMDFALTDAQVKEEAEFVHEMLHQHNSQHHQHHQYQHTHGGTGVSLAMQAANALCQVEDMMIFGGGLPFTQSALIASPNSAVNYRFIPTDFGLLNLGQMPANQIVPVSPLTPNGPYQQRTVAAVAQAFSILQGFGADGPYFCVLQTTPFAEAHAPLASNLLAPAELIKSLMNAGFYAGILPPTSRRLRIPWPTGSAAESQQVLLCRWP